MDVPVRGLAVWAGKPAKIGRRLFVYAAGRDRDLVAKVALHDDPWLSREHAAIAALREILGATPAGAALPAAIRYEHPVLVQPFVPGLALTELLLRGRRGGTARKTFLQTVAWLSGFHRCTASTDGDGRGWTHGDFKPSNVLIDEGRIGVIDWELAGEGWQEFDFWHLATYSGLTCAGGGNSWAAFSRVFLEPTWISALVAEGLKRYLGVEAVPRNAAMQFQRYLDDVLDRRTVLGLSNEAYFLDEIRRRLISDPPRAFLPV